MSAIFFQLSATHEAELKKLMKETGYTKKSEFFRFLLNYYRFACAAENLGKTLTELDKRGMIPPLNEQSLAEQLKDV